MHRRGMVTLLLLMVAMVTVACGESRRPASAGPDRPAAGAEAPQPGGTAAQPAPRAGGATAEPTPAAGGTVAQPAPATGGTTAEPAPEQQPVTVVLFRPADLLSGHGEPYRTWQLQTATPTTGLALSPDGETALLYGADPMIGGPRPYLLHLPTGTQTDLALPDDGTWYSYGAWTSDGRLVVVGRSVWVGGPHGEGLKPIGANLFAWSAWLSPDGTRLALWGPAQQGAVTLVDLKAETAREVVGPFRRGCQDCGVTLAWSPDGSLLAGTDFDNDAGPAPPRTRVINPATGEQVRTIEGLMLTRWFPDGTIMAMRRSSPPDGEPTIIFLDEAGHEQEQLKGEYIPSPDGRFLLSVRYDGSRQQTTLIERATGKTALVKLPGYPRWTPSGEILATSH